MKKSLPLVLILTPLFLAGCSLGPQNGSNTPPPPNPNNSIWESLDSGKTWTNNAKSGQKTDISNVDVISLAVNPFDAKNVYVGLRGPGILKTDDGGLTWDYLAFQSQKVYGLDISPADGRIIYASGVWQNRGKIFKSTDSGATWNEIYTAASAGPLIINLVIDKKNPNTIYAATSDKQIIKSTDAGTSWKNIFTANSPVLKIAIDRANDGLVYGIAQGGDVLRSRDGGQNWESLNKQFSSSVRIGSNPAVLETDPSNANWVYVAGSGGLFVSKDTGNTWQKLNLLNDPQNFPVRAVAVNPANSNDILYGAAQAAYRSLDGGQNWETFQFNVPRSLNVLKFSTTDPAQLYLGFSK